MRTRTLAAIVTATAAAHWVAYTILWGTAFALGTGSPDSSVARVLGNLAELLGTPLMHSLILGPDAFAIGGVRWWGDDTNLILGLFAMNALIWGGFIAWVVRLLQARRAARGSTRAV